MHQERQTLHHQSLSSHHQVSTLTVVEPALISGLWLQRVTRSRHPKVPPGFANTSAGRLPSPFRGRDGICRGWPAEPGMGLAEDLWWRTLEGSWSSCFARKTLWSGPPVPSEPSNRGCTRAGESRSLCKPFPGDLVWPGCLLPSPPPKWSWPNPLGHVCVPPRRDLVGRVVFFLGALILGRMKPLAGAGWHAAFSPSQHLEISETHAAKPRLKKLLVVQEHLLGGGERKAFHSSLSFGAS